MKKQKVNWILYLILGILSIGTISASLLFKDCAEWFTIISGIGCGAFASVVIAYLIDLANVNQKRRKNADIFESYFSGLYFNFAILLSSFYIACREKSQSNIGELYWFDWLKKLIEEQKHEHTPSTENFLVTKLQDVEKEITKIEENQLLLLSQDLIDDTNIIFLTSIKIDLSFIIHQLESSTINWTNIELIIPELKEHIENSKILRNFNNVKYNDLKKLLFTR